ncbi:MULTISPECIES: Y-family DNA polymerase [Thermus]|uniref:Y-family DNA polymerase n=1 Tax=Thermus TaxID=270 RepID=UPI00242DD5A8|nr:MULTISPECIES: hypothetical protein [Thermus]
MVAAALFRPWPVWLLGRERPELQDLPLALHRGGRVVALSPKARRLGVREGMGVEVARMRAAGLALLPYPAHAAPAWRALLQELYRLTPWVEPLEEGTVLLGLAPAEARLLAEGYGVRVGVAAWREVALLAAWAAREGEARVVAEGAERAFLARLPLHFLRGVGLGLEGLGKLRLLGLKRVGELLAWSPAQLRAYLPEGERLLPYLHGPWHRGVARFPEAPQVEARAPLDPQGEVGVDLLEHLARRLHQRLAGRAALWVAVEAVGAGLRFRGEHLAKAPLREEKEVRLALELAFRRSGAWGMPLEEVRAAASGLHRPAHQEGLFRRPGAGLGPLLARYPGALLRVEVLDPEALAPEWGFRYRSLEVEDAALPGAPHGPRSGGETPVGGLGQEAAGGAPPGPLAGRRALVAP